jgi:hypothetical protein
MAYDLPTYTDGWMKAPFIRVAVGNVHGFADEVIRLLHDSRLQFC